jgi:hypothetical protein
MFEVLTGERLFVHAGLTTSADEIYSQPVPQVSRKVPGLTTDLDAIMTKALALSPNARFQTASEFQEALTRCAHRNGLLMSAPEVARELLELCGPPDQWRGDDDDDDLGYFARAGTEVYDGADDEAEDEGQPADADASLPGAAVGRSPSLIGVRPIRPPSLPGVPDASMSMSVTGRHPRQSSGRLPRPRPEVAKLQGVVELTSIINMIDLENQHREALGERPLVDLDFAPSPAPASRSFDSDTRTGRGDDPPVVPRRRPEPTDPRDLMPTEPRELLRLDPGDTMPTSPRPLPALAGPLAPSPPAPNPLQSRPVPHFPAPGPVRSQAKPRRKSLLKPWMLLVAILLAAAVAGIVVAMSGPDVAVQRGK